MPFFNFRRATSTPANDGGAVQPESMEAVRKRAKHRLIGTSVLVLVGVVGFPLLFDTQPRPIAVDIPIEIPGKNSVKPLLMPAAPETAKEIGKEAAAPAKDKLPIASSLDAQEEVLADTKPAADASLATLPKKDTEPVAKPEVKPEIKAAARPEPKAETKAEAKADDGVRARALLEGRAAADNAATSSGVSASAAAAGRVVVQVGAFADADRAKEVRQKLERAGLKTYTQVAETKDGKRIRVRVGPFATKAEAEQAASKIKTLDLPASILTL